MKDKLTRKASILALALLAILASAALAPAASAAEELSPGCQLLNEGAGGFYVDGGGRTAFNAGDRITVTAGYPAAAEPGDPINLEIAAGSGDWRVVDSTSFPGTVEYVIPAAGQYGYNWYSGVPSKYAPVTWTVSCSPTAPSCSGLSASPSVLKADGKLQEVTLSGATDPEGEALTYSITAVTQDEHVASGFRGDTTFPDALGASGNSVSVRGERNPKGNGRVYRIHYTVTDASGFECSGFATVAVPVRKGAAAVDDGDHASWNSFTGALVSSG